MAGCVSPRRTLPRALPPSASISAARRSTITASRGARCVCAEFVRGCGECRHGKKAAASGALELKPPRQHVSAVLRDAALEGVAAALGLASPAEVCAMFVPARHAARRSRVGVPTRASRRCASAWHLYSPLAPSPPALRDCHGEQVPRQQRARLPRRPLSRRRRRRRLARRRATASLIL